MTDDQAIQRFIEVFGFTREKGLYYLRKHAKKQHVSEAYFARSVLKNLAKSNPRSMVNRLMKNEELPPAGYEAALTCARSLCSAAKYGGTVIDAYERLRRKGVIDELDARMVQNGNDISFYPATTKEETNE